MSELKELQQKLSEGRESFLSLVEALRPQLHRYCSRMVGSVVEGEDIVQDTLAKAYYKLSMTAQPLHLKPWLFRIAHNTALDHLRRYETRHVRLIEDVEQLAAEEEELPGERDELLRLALRGFLTLPAAQRACVILKDVLEHSLVEVAEVLSMSVPAVKAALHRGRAALRALPELLSDEPAGPAPQLMQRYAERFNARDWDGVRALLAQEVSLDVVSAAQRFGKAAVGGYFHRYEAMQGWRLRVGSLEGAWVFLVDKPGTAAPLLIQVEHDETRVLRIRDFHHVEYLLV